MRSEYAEFGNRLKRLREINNLNQSQMADIAGCSLRNYQKIESGETQPGYVILCNIVKNLSVDPKELFYDNHNDENASERTHIELLLKNCSGNQLKMISKIIHNIIDLWP